MDDLFHGQFNFLSRIGVLKIIKKLKKLKKLKKWKNLSPRLSKMKNFLSKSSLMAVGVLQFVVTRYIDRLASYIRNVEKGTSLIPASILCFLHYTKNLFYPNNTKQDFLQVNI